jgi:tryptophanase
MEPYRIKAVEPIPFPSRGDREQALTRSGYNLFRVPSAQVTIDLLTDSGTGSMSAAQWAAMMIGDEAYACSTSYERFDAVLRGITGFPEIMPVHQGRAAERVVFSTLLGPGDIVVSNTHFDTTRAHVEATGSQALDLPSPEAADLDSDHPFKGNIDLGALTDLLAGPDGHRVKAVVMTVTNNGGGGQPVSLENLRRVRAVCDEHGLVFLLDASRFAENSWLVLQRERGHGYREPVEVARATFDLADVFWASLKKDGLANIGGVIGVRDDPELARRFRQQVILDEGFSTYGGLAGRDLEALAQGLSEVTDPRYLADRADTARWFADSLHKAGVPVVRPAGCHAVYVRAGEILPHIPAHRFPGHAWSCALYLEGGIRAVEFGSLLLGSGGGSAPHELVRLALPRRVYTRSHLEYVVDTAVAVGRIADELPGYRIVGDSPALRHFTAVLEPAPHAG